MQWRPIVLLLGLSSLSSACASVEWVEFKNSSLDFNGGRVHRTTIKDADPKAVLERITELAEKRDVVLVFSACKGDICECSLKKKPMSIGRRSVVVRSVLSGRVEGSEHKSVSISSLIFSRVTRRGDDAVLDMLGAPIIDENVIGCPMALQVERRCRPMALEVPAGKTPEEVYRSDLGVDISGQAEAQIISGILAELKHGSRRPLGKEDAE